jgi:U3 small nucleolar RNA-associated protein 20
MGIVLRHCPSYTLPPLHLSTLLSHIQQHLLSRSTHYQTVAFALLKGLLVRRVMAPTLYDMMATVQQLMIQSTNQTVQKQCGGVLLQFLMDYPLGAKRYVVTRVLFHPSAAHALCLLRLT